MQYLLTEEEWNRLIEKAENNKNTNDTKLQNFCTMVADNLLVDWKWSGDEPKKPWKCILSVKGEWYCDECPCVDVCPHRHKRWSK